MNSRLMQWAGAGVALSVILWCGRVTAAEQREDSTKSKSAKTEKTQKAAPKRPPASAEPALEFPPRLPDGAKMVSDSSREFLEPLEPLLDGVSIAKTSPTVDFAYFPGQTYPGRPWSNWGD